ncbi:protein phosphatase 1 regulatory subunit INH3-like [Zingiber officinale]|uniref:Uncharacterized protein n=1 Tax=Zingiber officinale TaxID=94328 RepID=A0A8J5HEB4_ZINOF|nr:protein phosphatase 1 regulatory subunit INH3-like [Zingiber officinale]XP_042464877.1 protein phosphatase 1 regulatory subunit INH3-like [Zingiber officinale]KAG6526371.1 hypothetical protein ZIOFF_016354 [Zingiber officinale]
MARLASPSTAAVTITLDELPSSSSPPRQSQPPQETLVLRLRRPKKKVTWKEGTVDNEFLNRKSSKKCCIFHKQKPFDEDDSDEDEGPRGEEGGIHDRAGPSHHCCSHDGGH